MAFEEVNEHNVYLTTGQPLPTDIAKIVEWMLNENFSTAYQSKTTPHLPALSCNFMTCVCGHIIFVVYIAICINFNSIK